MSLLRRSVGATRFGQYGLASLGDGPKLALAVLGFWGPLSQAGEPIVLDSRIVDPYLSVIHLRLPYSIVYSNRDSAGKIGLRSPEAGSDPKGDLSPPRSAEKCVGPRIRRFMKSMKVKKGCTILYVNEDVDEGGMLTLLLKRERDDKVIYCEPKISSVLEKLSQNIPDLILLQAVGNIDPFDFYNRLKAIPKLQKVPVILWRVSHLEEKRPSMARQIGMEGYVFYMYQPHHLLEARDTVLSGHK